MKVVGPSPLYEYDPLNKEVYGKSSSVGLPPGRVAVIVFAKDNVKALIALTTPVAPSVTLNVILNSPALASSVLGVMVNTLSA